MQVANQVLHRQHGDRKFMANRRSATVAFIDQFRKGNLKFELKREGIHAHEFAYLITDNAEGKFFVYGINGTAAKDHDRVLTSEDVNSIKKLVPEDQEFVEVARGFHFEADEENCEITVRMGGEWLFAVLVDEELGCYTIERNEYLDRSSDIYVLIKTAAKAFRIARGY